MPAIKPSCIRDLKARVDLGEVISRVVGVKRAGTRLKALCPFHQEKTPSFNIDPTKGFYKCFGCGKSGDAITFVQETEQLTFTEAVEALGERFGIAIEYEDGAGPSREDRSLRQELFDIHDQAAAHYHEIFKTSGPAGDFMRAYWTDERKFPASLADEFRIGAAPADDPRLAARLLKRNYSEDALRQCGLFFLRDGAPISASALRTRFRGRLIVPIRDHQGRVVAFTARQTSLTPGDDPAREAKYVNSPETPIFTKGSLLFNLDRARTAAGEDHPFLMVEGQLDALRCWQAGLKTVVATQGTAVTETQLALLRRYHPQLECLFDSDSAGRKAALRLVPLALKTGIEARFLQAPGDGKIDPDLLFLERGAAAYEDLKKTGVSALAFACRSILPEPAASSPEQAARAAQSILEIIAAAESEVARAGFIAETATHLGLPAGALQRDFDRMLRRIRPSGSNSPNGPAATPSARPVEAGQQSGASSEEHLLLLCLHFEKIARALSIALPHDWIDITRPAGILLNRFLSEIEHGTWPGRDHLDPLLETQAERTLVAGLLFESPALEEPVKIAIEGVRQLRARALEPRLRQIELALANCSDDSQGDALSLLKESLELQRKLRQPPVLAVVG